MDIMDKREELAQKALILSRDELYSDMPFLGIALSKLSYRSNRQLVTTATDGEYLYFHEDHILRLFRDNPVYLNRLYLHSLLHLLFAHPWLRGDRDVWLWGIAADMAVEYVTDSIEKPCIKRVLGLTRTTWYDRLLSSGRGISAAVIYRELENNSHEINERLYHEFAADDHVFWPKESRLTKQQSVIQKNWQQTAKQTEEKRRSGQHEGDSGDALSFQIRASKSRTNYRDFLRAFMVLHEEMRVDPDEFDIGFYMYGLSLYKNLPLIEPVETKETKRIRDFCIAVDTSYSTSGELIRSFLKETLTLIRDSDSFFRESRVHLIQADDEVREDRIISGGEDAEVLFSDFEVKGGGNTDFRPVFSYVDELSANGAFEQLCGLIYFTDGLGVYPEKEPAYKTAFVFLDEYDGEIPPWAIRIVIDEAELGRHS